MFGSLAHLIPARPTVEKPKEVPPPTPVNLPQCRPRSSESSERGVSGDVSTPIPSLLQSIIRPPEIKLSHLEALRVNVIPDCGPSELVPDPAYAPDFAKWDTLTVDEARDLNEQTRFPLNTGALSPGCQTYVERKNELHAANEAAFRAVSRVPPPPGQQQARLGNSYEFFKNLESFSMFWDDTSKPLENLPGDKGEKLLTEPSSTAEEGKEEKKPYTPYRFFRTSSGVSMPPEYRIKVVGSFIKLVSYDFGCNVSAPRTEPRLQITAPASSSSFSAPSPPQTGRSSYFSSGCTFIFRTPRTRNEARAGVLEGPLAAVSVRHNTTFSPESMAEPDDQDAVIDLARELVAALLTAQHRAREGRSEKRVGHGAWWTTKPRWGGGPGGPIGREVDYQQGGDEIAGDKDELPSPSVRTSSSSRSEKPAAKKSRKNMAMYDNYRMVRPPAAVWDPKTKYEAIGRARGADYDDIFVISCLFHHVSILRVRVPDRLLEVLDGAPEKDESGQVADRSWGRVDVWRSRWLDLFKAADRIEGVQLVWAMMAYLMRKQQDEEGDQGEALRQGMPGEAGSGTAEKPDVKMGDA